MILKAILESATVATYDGETLELAFPPDRKVGPQKVEERQVALKAAGESMEAAAAGVERRVRLLSYAAVAALVLAAVAVIVALMKSP